MQQDGHRLETGLKYGITTEQWPWSINISETCKQGGDRLTLRKGLIRLGWLSKFLKSRKITLTSRFPCVPFTEPNLQEYKYKQQ